MSETASKVKKVVSPEERARVKELREKLKEEYKAHERVAKKAIASTRTFNYAGRFADDDDNPHPWHVDPKPTIADLPEGTKVAYQIIPVESGMWRAGNAATIRIRLQAKGSDTPEEGELAHAGKYDNPAWGHWGSEEDRNPYQKLLPVVFINGDQAESFDGGVIKAIPGQFEGSTESPNMGPQLLLAMDSASQDFALVERAIDVVTTGEQAREAHRSAGASVRGPAAGGNEGW